MIVLVLKHYCAVWDSSFSLILVIHVTIINKTRGDKKLNWDRRS